MHTETEPRGNKVPKIFNADLEEALNYRNSTDETKQMNQQHDEFHHCTQTENIIHLVNHKLFLEHLYNLKQCE